MKLLLALNRLILWAALFVPMTGCEQATVYVSHPQVFTRERLVMSRQRELQFLYKQLDKEVTTGFQGAIDSRSLTAFQNSLAADISPTPTSQPAATGTLDFSNIVLPAPTTQSVASNLTLSNVDHFSDQMAFRDSVNAVIREKELDDTHDLHGHTLYTLKFDSAIMPGTHAKRPAIVLIQLQSKPPTQGELNELYDQWIRYLDDRLRRNEGELVSRALLHELTTQDFELIKTNLFDGVELFRASMNKLFPNSSDIDPFCEKIKAATSTFANAASGSNVPLDFWSEIGLKLAVDAKYMHDFHQLVQVDYKVLGGIGASFEAISVVRPGPNDPTKAFRTLLGIGTSLDEKDLYVDSIDPQEYAQNVSDVSADSRLLNLAFSINALLGKTASVKDTAQFLKQEQSLLQAIKRNPLAIGFHQGSKFGWLIGSPFQISTSHKAEFIHQPARESFAVSIVAPVWLNHLSLTPNSWWLNDDGDTADGVKVEGCGQFIELPTDYEAITTGILYQNLKRPPVLSVRGASWTLQSGLDADQTLLILGPDLWRNPQVFVDSQRADTVDVLPDMSGILAHFPKVLPLLGNAKQANLTVVTTFGATSLANAVTVLPPETKSSSIASAKLSSGYVVAASVDQGISFAVNGAALPSGFAGYVLRVRPADGLADWKDIDVTGMSRLSNGTVLVFPVPLLAGAAFGAAPLKLAVDFRLKLNPFDDPINLLAQVDPAERTVVYFPTKDQEKPRLATTQPVLYDKIKFVPDAVALKPADNASRDKVYDAFPGLKESVKAGSARLLLQQTGQDASYPLPVAESADGFTAAMPLNRQDLPDGTYDTLTLQFKSTGTFQSAVKVTNGPIRIQTKP